MPRSVEEELIQRYFGAFNRHEIESVIACFHDEPHLIDSEGVRHEGQAAVRRFYEEQFATFPRWSMRLANVHGTGGLRHGRVSFHWNTRTERAEPQRYRR